MSKSGGRKCSVPGCGNYYGKTKCNTVNSVSYYGFPNNTERREIWLKRSGFHGNPDKGKICSDHFDLESFERSLREELLGLKPKKLLKANAIPSLKLPTETVCQSSQITNCSPQIGLNELVCEIEIKQEISSSDIKTENNCSQEFAPNVSFDNLERTFENSCYNTEIPIIYMPCTILERTIGNGHNSEVPPNVAYGILERTIENRNNSEVPPNVACGILERSIENSNNSEVPPNVTYGILETTIENGKNSELPPNVSCGNLESILMNSSTQNVSFDTSFDNLRCKVDNCSTVGLTLNKSCDVLKHDLVNSPSTTTCSNLLQTDKDNIDWKKRALKLKAALDRTNMKFNNLSRSYSNTKKQLVNSKKRIRNKVSELISCKLTIKNLEVKLKQLSKKNSYEDKAKDILESVFSPCQIKVLLGKKRVNWSGKDIANGFALRQYLSKRAYRYLRDKKNIPLPGISTLQRYAANVNLKDKSRDNSLDAPVLGEENPNLILEGGNQ